jgi:hypothetical protein
VFLGHPDALVVHLQYRDIANNAHTSEIIVDFYRDPRSGNGSRRYADTIIDGVSGSSSTSRQPNADAPPGEHEDHPASSALATDYIQSWKKKRARRWVLK